MPEKFPPELESERARQGETSGRMRRVLAISLAGAIVLLVALLIWWRDVGQNRLPALGMLIAPVPTAVAETVPDPAAAPPRTAGATAPSGADTPVAPVPGAPAVPANRPSTTVDEGGVNRPADRSATGAMDPPPGAPRLPGTPMSPPTGPDLPP